MEGALGAPCTSCAGRELEAGFPKRKIRIYGFILKRISDERFFAVRPCEEEILKRIGEENGILDIKWRTLLKHMRRLPLSPPLPPGSFAPSLKAVWRKGEKRITG